MDDERAKFASADTLKKIVSAPHLPLSKRVGEDIRVVRKSNKLQERQLETV